MPIRIQESQLVMRNPHPLTMRSRQNLTEAMKEAAFAFAMCRLLAQQERNRGNNRLAGLLEKTAEQHYLKHFREQAELLELFGSDESDGSDAIVEESFVVDIICKIFAREANEDGDTEVARLLSEMHREESACRMRLDKEFQALELKSPTRTRRTRPS
jgi:rubrerythrin